jgi:hypothetical protein
MNKIDTRSSAFETALHQASDEHGLQDYYRSCVRPLFSLPVTHWPTCCGGGCEPCMQVVVAVASRICVLLAIDPQALG